jgi:hypothetical protein
VTSLRSSRVKRKSWKFISKLNGSWSGHPKQRNWDWQHSVRDLAPQAPNHWRAVSIKRSNAQSQRAAHLRQFTGPTLAAATPTAASLLATLGKVDRESLKISERAVSQCTLMRGAQDDPGRLVCFKCLLPTRGAQAPTVAWFQAREAKLWHRVDKSLPRDFENARNSVVMTAQTVWLPTSSWPVLQQPSR